MSGEQTAGGRGGGQETSDGDQRWGPNQVVAGKTISNFGVHSAVVQTGVTSGSDVGVGGQGPLPGDGTVLGSDAAAAILHRGERPGQQGEASERASGHLPAPTL